jgi:dihydrolipoamide dehydrogenase
VIYTSPEIAWVGKTEQQLKAEGVAYKAGKIPFAANGRALGMGDPSGFVKMLACADDRPHSRRPYHRRQCFRADLRGRRGDGVRRRSEDLARICHAHPTLSEVVHEAALACDKRPLHF